MRSNAAVRLCLPALALALALPAAQAGSRIEKEFPLSPGGEFVLDTSGGAVTVRGSERSTVLVVITSKRDNLEQDVDFKFETSPSAVRVTAERKGSGWTSWFGLGGRGSMEFEISVPKNTRCSIDTAGGPISASDLSGDQLFDTSGGPIDVAHVDGNVVADTSGGPISVESVRGDVKADTSGGPIRIASVEGNVSADTSGGPISIDTVTGDVLADTSGGGISINEAGGKVTADTSGGGVSVVFSAGNGKGGAIETSGGGITVTLDPSVSLQIDASAVGGSVKSDLPVTIRGEMGKGELKGTLGAGGPLLRIRSLGGPVMIKAR